MVSLLCFSMIISVLFEKYLQVKNSSFPSDSLEALLRVTFISTSLFYHLMI